MIKWTWISWRKPRKGDYRNWNWNQRRVAFKKMFTTERGNTRYSIYMFTCHVLVCSCAHATEPDQDVLWAAAAPLQFPGVPAQASCAQRGRHHPQGEPWRCQPGWWWWRRWCAINGLFICTIVSWTSQSCSATSFVLWVTPLFVLLWRLCEKGFIIGRIIEEFALYF